jgi:hypothetical protein
MPQLALQQTWPAGQVLSPHLTRLADELDLFS